MDALMAVIEAKTLAKLINGFGVFASQLLINNRPDLYDKAKNNLNRYRLENEATLKTLDQIAENTKSEKPCRLIEDIFHYSRQDAAGCMLLANRCLLACAFMGHLMASADEMTKPTTDIRPQETVLH
jgi:mannitol-1-phosphate/altronate dehydrogenase